MRFFIFFFMLIPAFLMAQNKQVLFDFAELPQALLLNPATEANYKYHAGVPLLSGISMHAAFSGVVLTDLFLTDNIDINTKLETVFNQLQPEDNILLNTQIDVLNGGFRYDDKTYFSFGFYEELDAFIYFPKDIVALLYEGNAAYLNRSFSISQLIFNIDVLGVLHIGATRKIDEKLTLGGRFKIYSSSLNVKTNNNTGTFTTNLGDNNIYRHSFNTLDAAIQTSGIFVDGVLTKNPIDIATNTFLQGNLGIGIDFGLTYHLSPQTTFVASIIDLGFTSHSKNNLTYSLRGSYASEGINFEFDSDNPSYWSNLGADLQENIPYTKTTDSYITWRPTKVNMALKYSFGRQRIRRECYFDEHKEYYNNGIGLQLYTAFRPFRPQFALTGFYEKRIHKNFHTKVTYTIDKYQGNNVGLGIATQIGVVNLYGMVDNIFKLSNIATANSISFQLGVNLIFKE